MLPVPFEKMKSEGFIFSQHFWKICPTQCRGPNFVSFFFKKKKSEPPYSKTRHQLGGGGRYKMEHGVSGTDLWRLSDISAKSGTVGKKYNPRSSGIFPDIWKPGFNDTEMSVTWSQYQATF